jgi:hypothetical protein
MAMKKFFARLGVVSFGAAALACSGAAIAADMPVKAPVITATQTASPLSAEIGAYFGKTWSLWDDDGTLFRNHPTLYGGTARANLWLAPNFSAQLDLEGEKANKFKSIGDGGQQRQADLYGGHFAFRDPQKGAFGAFGGVIDSNDLLFIGIKDFHEGFYGVEGQVYFSNLTLYGQAGRMERISGVDEAEPDHMWFVRGAGRYFFTPNDKLQAEFAYAKGRAFGCSTGCSDIKLPMWGASFEHRFDNSPLSVFVEYSGFTYSGRFDLAPIHEHVKATENMLMAGAKLYFGEGTLLAADRSGTTFDMPKFIRALPWATLAGP